MLAVTHTLTHARFQEKAKADTEAAVAKAREEAQAANKEAIDAAVEAAKREAEAAAEERLKAAAEAAEVRAVAHVSPRECGRLPVA